MISTIQFLLLAAVGMPLFYLLFLTLLVLLARKNKNIQTKFYRTFAVVIPAHNEELVIDRTLHSLQRLNYPQELYDIIVVADNCTDRTADIARSLDAVVLERTDPDLRGKGHALRWCFDLVLDTVPEYDAVVVIDADSAVSANFLHVMNFYLERDAKAIQASDLVAPSNESWSADATRLGFTLYNYVRPLGRGVIGCSAGLRGNGMCFAAETLRKYPWQAYSLTEDLEYGLHLLMNEVPVVFAPEALVLATMPVNASNAETQRTRWEAGRLPIVRTYVPRLLRYALTHGSFRALDACIDLLTPPFVNLFAVAIILCVGTLTAAATGVSGGIQPFVIPWMVTVLAGMLHVIIGLFASGADRSMYRTLALFPRYFFWKILLYTKLARNRRNDEWVRTTREQTALPR